MTPGEIERYLRMPEGAVPSLLELPAGDDGRQLSLPDPVLTRRAAA
jgi:hypothetical protein